MSFKTSIPSIAGAPVARWASWFAAHVELWSEYGQPLKGSLGIDFSVHMDLAELCAEHRGDRASMHASVKSKTQVVRVCPGFSGPAKPITEEQVNMVLDFFFWAQSDQPYFFLRRGTQTLGLYRKTSAYFYKVAPDTLQHRVSYEFVRAVTEEERTNKHTIGQVPPTLIWRTAELPAPKPLLSPEQSLDETLLRLARTRAAIGTLVSELDAALTRFTSSVA
jgi:hypothetical protein